ncbi:hypothetical protein BC828DRAFT_345961 [Blastocladiella britannica]|nr:hypothetical protein BC828DRAFT_345961 [Blastocladiella britannica]
MDLLPEIRSIASTTVDDAEPFDSIDYMHLRPGHVNQLNELLSDVFWPGIDVSDMLHAPECGIVAMYRRLIVGCVLATPDGYIAFVAVRPTWTGLGIGSRMMTWVCESLKHDVTLHVSANNPAVIIYQQLGFKAEEFVLDFYEKYMPPESTDSRHAFFLRMRK